MIAAPAMLDLQSVKQALLVADHLSIRRAADQLGLRPSAVSRRIRSLEDQLGVTLFERHSAGVELTLAGLRFLDRARWAVAELDYAARSATSIQKGDTGALTIAFYPSLASGLLHQILAEHRARFPHVEFDFLEAAPADRLVAVRQHRADAAFLLAASIASTVPGLATVGKCPETVGIGARLRIPSCDSAWKKGSDAILVQPT